MIIDFHTHIFPDAMAAAVVEKLSKDGGIPPYSDGTASGLLQSMEQSGVTHSVVLPVATNPYKVSSVNRANVLELEDGKIIHFGAMHPDCPDWKQELHTLASHGCKGIKIHPVYQGVDLDDIRYLRILEEAASLNMTVVTHTGDDIGFPGVVHCSPAMALHALQEIGSIKLVLAHMGGWHCWEEATELLSAQNVWIDTSFSAGKVMRRKDAEERGEVTLLTRDAFVDMIRSFGSKYVLFGTDSPWTAQKDSVQYLLDAGLDPEETDNILFRNATSLLNL